MKGLSHPTIVKFPQFLIAPNNTPDRDAALLYPRGNTMFFIGRLKEVSCRPLHESSGKNRG